MAPLPTTARLVAATCALLWAFAAAAQHTVPDTMAQRMLACAACHGKEGRATNQGYFPRIAGKPAGYLYNQLVNFREGRRGYPPMAYLVEHLSDAYLREIASYFATLDLPYPPPQTRGANAALLRRGEGLVKQGDPARGIPACTSCHGDALTGVMPAFPGLLGLPRDYLVSQFGSWRNGQRKAVAPDCMADITKRLSAEDIEALSTWLSSQPLPSNTRPTGAVALPLPLDCGSGLR